jgi:riboflavin synthase
MFTGIIQEVGNITQIKKEDWFYFTIASSQVLKSAKIGSSIAVDGVCLTVLEFDEHEFTVQVMPETVEKTSFANKKVGDQVNLESSLKIGDSLDGHFVMGHVDGVGNVIEIVSDHDNWVIRIQPHPQLMKYIAYKGSIAVNGTSLTVSNRTDTYFEVSLIKHTLENTNLGQLSVANQVNLEVDMFARYIENLTKNQS